MASMREVGEYANIETKHEQLTMECTDWCSIICKGGATRVPRTLQIIDRVTHIVYIHRFHVPIGASVRVVRGYVDIGRLVKTTSDITYQSLAQLALVEK